MNQLMTSCAEYPHYVQSWFTIFVSLLLLKYRELFIVNRKIGKYHNHHKTK